MWMVKCLIHTLLLYSTYIIREKVKIGIIVTIGKMTNFGSDKYSSIQSLVKIPPPIVLEFLIKMYKHFESTP